MRRSTFRVLTTLHRPAFSPASIPEQSPESKARAKCPRIGKVGSRFFQGLETLASAGPANSRHEEKGPARPFQRRPGETAEKRLLNVPLATDIFQVHTRPWLEFQHGLRNRRGIRARNLRKQRRWLNASGSRHSTDAPFHRPGFPSAPAHTRGGNRPNLLPRKDPSPVRSFQQRPPTPKKRGFRAPRPESSKFAFASVAL